MKEKQEIESKNSKGQLHGYQQCCYLGELRFRGNRKHYRILGYWESHQRKITLFYIK
jgi:hypothetical protein